MIGITHFDHQSLPDFPPGPLRLRAGRRHGRRPRASKSVAMCCIFSLLCFKWRPHHNPLRKTARFSALGRISRRRDDIVNRLSERGESIQARRQATRRRQTVAGEPQAGCSRVDGRPWTCAPSAAAREPNGRGKGRPMCAGAGADPVGRGRGQEACARARFATAARTTAACRGPPSPPGGRSACAKPLRRV